jgi:hypothetical protein
MFEVFVERAETILGLRGFWNDLKDLAEGL